MTKMTIEQRARRDENIKRMNAPGFDSELRGLWANQDLSLDDIAKKLALPDSTVSQKARRLGLPRKVTHHTAWKTKQVAAPITGG